MLVDGMSNEYRLITIYELNPCVFYVFNALCLNGPVSLPGLERIKFKSLSMYSCVVAVVVFQAVHMIPIYLHDLF